MAKPTSVLNWTPSKTSTEPPAGVKSTGWDAGEQPPYEYFNWIHENISEWQDYLNDTYDVDTSNVYIGEDTGSVTLGTDNMGIGYQSLYSKTGSLTKSIGIGNLALRTAASGSNNVALGYRALYASSGDNNNTAIGSYAGDAVNAGGNTILGAFAAYSNTGSTNFVAIGYRTAYAATGLSHSVAIGYESLYGATSGGYAVAIGYRALYTADGLRNIGIGNVAGGAISSGDDNIVIGDGAGGTITTGNQNICIGKGADTSSGYTNNIAIGTNATCGYTNTIVIGNSALASASNQIVLGTSSYTGFKVCGNTGVASFGPSAVTSITVKNGIITAIS
jgi:hypothetical protein